MNRFFIFLISLFVAGVLPLAAQDARDVLNRAEEPFTAGRVHSVSRMDSYRGERLVRSMEFVTYTLVADGVSHSLVLYTDPPRMVGTAYLSVGNELWVKFGLTGRVRKLSSSARSGSAGGSDFSYADMGEGSGGLSESYSATLLRSSVRIDGRDCYEIELVPLAEESDYDRLLAYVSRETFRYMEIQYFQSGANTKTLTLDDYHVVDGVAYPFLLSMRTHASGTHTEIITRAVDFESPDVSEDMFTVEYLESL